MAQDLADLSGEIHCHLKSYRTPRGDRSEARLRTIGLLIGAFRTYTGAPQFQLIQDLLYLLTDEVSKATVGSLRQEENKYLQLLTRVAALIP